MRRNTSDSSTWILTLQIWQPGGREGNLKLNVLGTVVRSYFFCKYTDTKHPNSEFIIPPDHLNSVKGNYCSPSKLPGSLPSEPSLLVSFLSFHHRCVAILISLKSPQLSVSILVNVLLVIERLFLERFSPRPQALRPESCEEIHVTAFVELDADQGHTHNAPPFPWSYEPVSKSLWAGV